MTNQYLVFILDGQRYALHLSAVDRVVRMVHVTLLLKAPEVILGVVNMQGQIIPVISARQRFHLSARDVALTDQLVVAHTKRRLVALVVDTVANIVECSEHDLIAAQSILPAVEYLQGVIKLPDGLILVHNLDTFLSLEEEDDLSQALEAI